MISKLVTVRHLSRKAVVYIRQYRQLTFRTLQTGKTFDAATCERNQRRLARHLVG
jgi:hypothetical protein